MGNYTKDFQLLNATTSTGAGTATNVQGYRWLHFQTDGFNYGAAPATSTRVVAETTVNGTQWVLTTVLDLANNTATNTIATSSVFRLVDDIGGITGFRLRVATFNGIEASITAVGRAMMFAG